MNASPDSERRDTDPDSGREPARRRSVALTILLIGFGSALVIWLTARPAPPNPFGYEPEDTKRYLRQMEVYGGKANVLGSELRQWFDSLWHGRRLAVTVVFLTLALLLFYLVASTPLPPGEGASPHDGNPGDHPGP